MTASAEQEVQDEPEELRIEKEASERLLIFDLAQAISHDDMRARYAAISDRTQGLDDPASAVRQVSTFHGMWTLEVFD